MELAATARSGSPGRIEEGRGSWTASLCARAEQDRYRESLAPALEALEIRKRVLGAEHADTAMSLDLETGGQYFKLKDYAKAEPYCRQALETRKKIQGDEHPDTAISLGNLAALYQGERGISLRQAEPLLLQAFENSDATVGEGAQPDPCRI